MTCARDRRQRFQVLRRPRNVPIPHTRPNRRAATEQSCLAHAIANKQQPHSEGRKGKAEAPTWSRYVNASSTFSCRYGALPDGTGVCVRRYCVGRGCIAASGGGMGPRPAANAASGGGGGVARFCGGSATASGVNPRFIQRPWAGYSQNGSHACHGLLPCRCQLPPHVLCLTCARAVLVPVTRAVATVRVTLRSLNSESTGARQSARRRKV